MQFSAHLVVPPSLNGARLHRSLRARGGPSRQTTELRLLPGLRHGELWGDRASEREVVSSAMAWAARQLGFFSAGCRQPHSEPVPALGGGTTLGQSPFMSHDFSKVLEMMLEKK